MITLCLRHFEDDELQRNEFLQGLADLLDGNLNAHTEDAIYNRLSDRGGTDQLPNLGPLAARGGNTLANMINPPTAAPTPGSKDDWRESSMDRNAHDQRRRPAQDAVLASARREREESAFLARFPEAPHIQISNYISRYRI